MHAAHPRLVEAHFVFDRLVRPAHHRRRGPIPHAQHGWTFAARHFLRPRALHAHLLFGHARAILHEHGGERAPALAHAARVDQRRLGPLVMLRGLPLAADARATLGLKACELGRECLGCALCMGAQCGERNGFGVRTDQCAPDDRFERAHGSAVPRFDRRAGRIERVETRREHRLGLRDRRRGRLLAGGEEIAVDMARARAGCVCNRHAHEFAAGNLDFADCGHGMVSRRVRRRGRRGGLACRSPT